MPLLTMENAIAFLTLAALEIVLGIDNIVFIAIISNALPVAVQSKARKYGLLLAMGTRIVLLLAITWVMGLTTPILSVLGHVVTGRDIVLLAGGLFLIAQSDLRDSRKDRAAQGGACPGPQGAELRGGRWPRSASWTSCFPWIRSSRPWACRAKSSSWWRRSWQRSG